MKRKLTILKRATTELAQVSGESFVDAQEPGTYLRSRLDVFVLPTARETAPGLRVSTETCSN